MAATITWSVEECERTLSDGGIYMAHWRCSGTETVGTGDDAITYSSSVYGSSKFDPDPSDPSFVSYDNVTEANVLAWIYDSGVDQSACEASVQSRIDEQKTPTTGSGTPW